MATGMPNSLAVGLDALRRNWGWYLVLGIVQIVLGAIAIGVAVLTTLISVAIFGWLLTIGGVVAVIHAFWQQQWGGFFIDLFVGLLYALVGLAIVAHPELAAEALTWFIALFLVAAGLFRIVVGLNRHFAHRGWLLLNGVVTLLLGLLIWSQWPLSALWVIGLFVGIEMVFYGWSLVMLSIAASRWTAV